MDTPYRIEPFKGTFEEQKTGFRIVRSDRDFSCNSDTYSDARIVVDALNLVEHLAQIKLKP